VETDRGKVWIDCRKTRAVEQEWRNSPKELKRLSPANALNRLIGKDEDGTLHDFRRVTLKTLQRFADSCGRDPEEFKADKIELQLWQANQSSPSKKAAIPGGATMLQELHNRLSGFYELYYYSTTKSEAAKVSIALLHVNGIDTARSAIRCELHDKTLDRSYFSLVGHVREVLGFLHWSLGLPPELVVCHAFSYLPLGEMHPDFTLYGVFLTLAGDGKPDYPAAAKGALRYLGRSASEAVRNCIVDLQKSEEEPEDLLTKSVGGYVSDLQEKNLLRSDVLHNIETEVLPRIDNAISKYAVPRALIVSR
jgi:hypothetical protein